MSEKHILQIGAVLGFTPSPVPGFVGMADPKDPFGARRLDVFGWCNAKHADEKGIPRRYLVLCPSFSVFGESGRWVLPLVTWLDAQGKRIPSATQRNRPWPEVMGEAQPVLAEAFATYQEAESTAHMNRFWELNDLMAFGQKQRTSEESL